MSFPPSLSPPLFGPPLRPAWCSFGSPSPLPGAAQTNSLLLQPPRSLPPLPLSVNLDSFLFTLQRSFVIAGTAFSFLCICFSKRLFSRPQAKLCEESTANNQESLNGSNLFGTQIGDQFIAQNHFSAKTILISLVSLDLILSAYFTPHNPLLQMRGLRGSASSTSPPPPRLCMPRTPRNKSKPPTPASKSNTN